MTCLKYGQCHYWFNLNRPLVIVPCCGSPWMLKRLTGLKNSGEEDKPSLLCWKEDHMQSRSGRYMRQTQVFCSIMQQTFWLFFQSLYMQFIRCCHTELILHHYDCNHEMKHFEDELRWPSHLFLPRLFFLSQPQCGQVGENMFSKHDKSKQQAQCILMAESIFIYPLQYNVLIQVLS